VNAKREKIAMFYTKKLN